MAKTKETIEATESEKPKKEARYRIFNIMQYEKNPVSGEVLLTKEKIESVFAKYKSFSRWAWIYHDKDVYTILDEEADPTRKRGTPKAPHFHIVIECALNPCTLTQISERFGIPKNFIELPRGGQRAFADCVEYLTHEHEKQQELGKTQYADYEVNSNFDFRRMLRIRNLGEVDRVKEGLYSDDLEKYMCLVMYNGMTLREVENEVPILLGNNLTKFQRWRKDYISRHAELPIGRSNFYISGNGGDGKGYLSRALARTLFPHIEDDRELFYEVGSDGCSFQTYDGQPVIIWNDFRAFELLSALGGRGNVFDAFDTKPSSREQNIKFGSVRLINSVNIVNSVQSYDEFLDGLAGEYKAKDGSVIKSEEHKKVQSWRRFNFIGILREDDFELLINSGYLRKGSYFDYESVNHFKFRMRDLIADCHGDEKAITGVIRKNAKALKSAFDDSASRSRDLTDDETKEVMAKYCQENEIIEAEFVEVKQEQSGTDVPENEAVSDEDLPF